jgi:hypothetical protein
MQEMDAGAAAGEAWTNKKERDAKERDAKERDANFESCVLPFVL